VDGRQVADGEFVESCCYSPVLLELVDSVLDGVAVAIGGLVERGWLPAAGTAVAAMSGLAGI
jgi:hypothetical protein